MYVDSDIVELSVVNNSQLLNMYIFPIISDFYKTIQWVFNTGNISPPLLLPAILVIDHY